MVRHISSVLIQRIIKLFDQLATLHEENMSENNVVDLWNRPKKELKEKEQVNPFAETIDENRKRKERQEKERFQKNRSVLRDYNIKNPY